MAKIQRKPRKQACNQLNQGINRLKPNAQNRETQNTLCNQLKLNKVFSYDHQKMHGNRLQALSNRLKQYGIKKIG